MEGMGLDGRGFVWQVLVGRRGLVRPGMDGRVEVGRHGGDGHGLAGFCMAGFGWQAWPGVARRERHGSGGGFGWQAWCGGAGTGGVCLAGREWFGGRGRVR